MSREPDHPQNSDVPALPEKLAGDLRRLYGHPGIVPDRVDRALAATTRAHFARQKTVRRLLRWVAAGAAAAIIVFAIRVAVVDHPTSSVARLDTSSSHQIDILDAFALARELKVGKRLDQSWDVNHDGAIDQKDVQALAAQSVKITREDVQ